MFCNFCFAAWWDSLDVAAQGDYSSAIKPKVELSERMVGIDGGLVSTGMGSLTRCRGTGVRSPSVFPSLLCLPFFAAFFVLRDARQVETLAACIFRHLPQVVFILAGSL